MAVLKLKVLILENSLTTNLTFPFIGSRVVTYQTYVTNTIRILAAFLCESANYVIHIEILPATLGIEQVHVAVIVDLYAIRIPDELQPSLPDANQYLHSLYRRTLGSHFEAVRASFDPNL